MKLKVKPLKDTARILYENHGHFHNGDAGLDLYVLEDQIFVPGETKLIKLGISCEPEDGKAYFWLA
jgi:dUTP pyrophosphatase